MFDLQPFDCLEHLFYLIGLCQPFAVLDVYPWVTYPWCLIHPMATAALTSLPEIMVAYLAEIGKMNPCGIATHFFKNFGQVRHKLMVSIMILLVNGGLILNTQGFKYLLPVFAFHIAFVRNGGGLGHKRLDALDAGFDFDVSYVGL